MTSKPTTAQTTKTLNTESETVRPPVKWNSKEMDSSSYRLSRVPKKNTKDLTGEKNESYATLYYKRNPGATIDKRTPGEKLNEINQLLEDLDNENEEEEKQENEGNEGEKQQNNQEKREKRNRGNEEEDEEEDEESNEEKKFKEKLSLLIKKKALVYIIYTEDSYEAVKAHFDIGYHYHHNGKPSSAIRHLMKAKQIGKEEDVNEILIHDQPFAQELDVEAAESYYDNALANKSNNGNRKKEVSKDLSSAVSVLSKTSFSQLAAYKKKKEEEEMRNDQRVADNRSSQQESQTEEYQDEQQNNDEEEDQLQLSEEEIQKLYTIKYRADIVRARAARENQKYAQAKGFYIECIKTLKDQNPEDTEQVADLLVEEAENNANISDSPEDNFLTQGSEKIGIANLYHRAYDIYVKLGLNEKAEAIKDKIPTDTMSSDFLTSDIYQDDKSNMRKIVSTESFDNQPTSEPYTPVTTDDRAKYKTTDDNTEKDSILKSSIVDTIEQKKNSDEEDVNINKSDESQAFKDDWDNKSTESQEFKFEEKPAEQAKEDEPKAGLALGADAKAEEKQESPKHSDDDGFDDFEDDDDAKDDDKKENDDNFEDHSDDKKEEKEEHHSDDEKETNDEGNFELDHEDEKKDNEDSMEANFEMDQNDNDNGNEANFELDQPEENDNNNDNKNNDDEGELPNFEVDQNDDKNDEENFEDEFQVDF